jgi:tetratricopeptide (TPR) repeat protein
MKHTLRRCHILGYTVALALFIVAGVSMLGCETTYQSDIRYSAPDPADEEFRSGVDRRPTATTLYAMSRVLVRQGRDNEAEMMLRHSLEQYPRFVPAYNELAQLYLRRSKVGDAMQVLYAGLEHEQNNSMLHNNLGMCWFVRGEHERALDRFTKAAAIDPEDARYRANMAATLGMMGRYEESLALYQQIVSLAHAHYNLSVICEARDDHERAETEYLMALELDPTIVNK